MLQWISFFPFPDPTMTPQIHARTYTYKVCGNTEDPSLSGSSLCSPSNEMLRSNTCSEISSKLTRFDTIAWHLSKGETEMPRRSVPNVPKSQNSKFSWNPNDWLPNNPEQNRVNQHYNLIMIKLISSAFQGNLNPKPQNATFPETLTTGYEIIRSKVSEAALQPDDQAN